jgi:fatty acid desaturase
VGSGAILPVKETGRSRKMANDTFRPIPEQWRELYNTHNFSQNIQFWFGLFAFSTFMVSVLFPFIRGNVGMEITTTQMVVLVIGSLLLLLFLSFVVWSFISLVIFVWKNYFGTKRKSTKHYELQELLKQSEDLNNKLRQYIKEREGESD